jgi:hypothetical protein
LRTTGPGHADRKHLKKNLKILVGHRRRSMHWDLASNCISSRWPIEKQALMASHGHDELAATERGVQKRLE